MKPHIQQQLIEAAILAPSADNSQPWRYNWDNEALELWIDETRSGGVSDQRFVLSDLALGACIENIVTRAHSLGYNSQIRYLPDPEQTPLWAARLTFSAAATQEEALAQSIPNRHTNRSFPWRGPMTTTTKQALSDEAAKLQGVTLNWLDATPRYKSALKAMWLAESLRFSNRELHQELFSCIRFEIDNSATAEEGLAPATLAIERPLRPAFKLLRHWRVMSALNWIGGNYLIGFRSTVLPTLLSPALCLLSIEQTDRTSIIRAGQALQRTWLSATAQGISLQPFAAAGVFSLGFIQSPPTLIPACRKISQLLDAISNNNQGLLFLRLGIATSASALPHNYRRTSSSFLLSTPHCQDSLQHHPIPRSSNNPLKNIFHK